MNPGSTATGVKKVNLKKTEAVDWELEIEAGSNKVIGKLAYTDDFEGWLGRAPALWSPHPDLPALLLKSIKPKREEGGIVRVQLGYECNAPEANYPGRPAGVIKRYSMEITAGEEPLLTNDLFKDLSNPEKEALQELMGSSKAKDDWDKAGEVVKSTQGVKALAKIRRGTESYLNPGLVWVERFTTKNLDDLELGKILRTTNSPPGGCPSGGSERNWLYLGGTASPHEDGEYWDVERRWQLSEIGKWDEDLYPGGA